MQNNIQTAAYPSRISLQKLIADHPSTSTMANFQAIQSHCYLKPETVNSVVSIQMRELMANYAAEEESFVDQKLIENPVTCARRPSVRSSSDSSSSNRDPIQQQKADACRRSRFNNKIKKAKSQFRHKFITMKLAQNATALECIRNVIALTEAKLRSKGCSEATLEKLRQTMGVDRTEINNLSEITKQLCNVPEN